MPGGFDRAAAAEARNAAGEPLVTAELLDGGVLLIRLNRPERANAWSEGMEIQYGEAFDAAVASPAVRSIVLTGAGRAFSPGMDRERLLEITSGGRPYMSERRPQTFLRSVPKPVIAAVNGACAGVGFVQALMADVRFTARSARWSAAFSRIGLIAEDGVANRLQRLAGDEVACDLLLSARAFDGEEAVRMRLAAEAFDADELLDAAVEYARDLARRSPAAMALIKRQLVLDDSLSLEEARVNAAGYLAEAKRMPDYAEGVAAAVESREPSFAGLAGEAIPLRAPR